MGSECPTERDEAEILLNRMSPPDIVAFEKKALGWLITAEVTEESKQQQITELLRNYDLDDIKKRRIRSALGIKSDEERALIANQESAQHAKSSARAAWWSILIAVGAFIASLIALAK